MLIRFQFEGELSFFAGLRVLTMFWTILVHVLLYVFMNFSKNTVGLIKYSSLFHIIYFYLIFLKAVISEAKAHFFSQWLGNGHFSVDTFFFMGAFLLVYLFKRAENKTTFKLTSYTRYFLEQSKKLVFLIFYRYFRLTPVYVAVIFLARFSMR